MQTLFDRIYAIMVDMVRVHNSRKSRAALDQYMAAHDSRIRRAAAQMIQDYTDDDELETLETAEDDWYREYIFN